MDGEHVKTRHTVLPIFTCLEIFPFWAIKLYLLSDLDLKEGWIQENGFTSNLLPHLKICSRYKSWENKNKAFANAYLWAVALPHLAQKALAAVCSVQCAYSLVCTYSVYQAGPALGLDTYTTSLDLFSWILQESFSNMYKEEIQSVCAVRINRGQKLGLHKNSYNIGSTSSRGKIRYSIWNLETSKSSCSLLKHTDHLWKETRNKDEIKFLFVHVNYDMVRSLITYLLIFPEDSTLCNALSQGQDSYS